MGKPEKKFYNMAIEDMGVPINQVVMIGDDIVSDIKGAKDIGIKTIQVKTGKYQEADNDDVCRWSTMGGKPTTNISSTNFIGFSDNYLKLIMSFSLALRDFIAFTTKSFL